MSWTIFFYSYLIENEVCYLVLCERNYSTRIAYNYLEDIAQEFHAQYGKRVNTVTRPYTFIEFGKSWIKIDIEYVFLLNIVYILFVFFQIPIFKKPRKSFQIVDLAEIWIHLTVNCKTCKESWYKILMMFYKGVLYSQVIFTSKILFYQVKMCMCTYACVYVYTYMHEYINNIYLFYI